MEYKFLDISNVEEETNAVDAQKYLDCGWVLLNTAESQEGKEGYIIYALGWPSSKGEVQTPSCEKTYGTYL